MRTKLSSKKGASLVEFALILPLLVIILFGIIEFGLLLYNQQVITNGSREGARAGIVSQMPRVGADEIIGVVQPYCDRLVTLAGAGNCGITPSVIPNASFGDNLTVTVTYGYGFLVLPDIVATFFGGELDDTLELRAATVMKYE